VYNWLNIHVQCYHLHSCRMLLTSDEVRPRPDFAMCDDIVSESEEVNKGIQSKKDATLLILEGVIAKSLELHSAKGLVCYHRHA